MKKFTNIKERILQIAELKAISKELFCQKIGISYASIKGSSKDRSVKSTTLQAILELYPDISPAWLLMGREPVFTSEIKSEQLKQRELTTEADAAESLGSVGGAKAEGTNSENPVLTNQPIDKMSIEFMKQLLNVIQDQQQSLKEANEYVKTANEHVRDQVRMSTDAIKELIEMQRALINKVSGLGETFNPRAAGL